jgi:two-component system cell cycle response regulator
MPDNEPMIVFRQSIGARIDSISASLTALKRGERDAAHSLRVHVATLGDQAGELGLETLRAAAAELVQADTADISACAGRLLDLLRRHAVTEMPESGVLIIGGDQVFAAALLAAIGALGRPVRHAQTGAEARALLQQHQVACIILHAVLTDLDGRTLLTRLRENPHTAAIPVLILADRLDESVKESMQLNSSDAFIEKPQDPTPIVDWVGGRLRRAPRASKPSRRDSLTGLLNRAAFRESFEILQRESHEAGEPMALAAISVDASRSVLSGFEPAAREEMLQLFGSLLSSSLRTTDVPARWGVYDFLALFPGENQEGGRRAIAKIIERLDANPLRGPAGEAVRFTISAGVALVREGQPLDDVIEETDHYVYQASTRGGSQVITERATEPEAVSRRVLLFVHDSVTAGVLNKLLEKAGFQIDSHSSWTPQTGAAISEHRFHLAVIDETLPPDGGLAVLKALRADPRNARLPIMMLIAQNTEQSVADALDNGANDYIVRPFSPAIFVGRTHRLLSRGLVSGGPSLFRILIVSDHVKTLVLLASTLQRRGQFDVILALGAEDAEQRIQHDAPDALFVELPLAPINGATLFERLARKPSPVALTVIVAEDPPGPDDPQPVAEPVAIRGRMRKPFNPLEFGGQVEALLDLPPVDRRADDGADRLNKEIQRIMKRGPRT